MTPKKLKWSTCSIVLLFIVILKLVIILGCLINIINLDFSTLSSSIFDFNLVVIFDISVFILFSMFMVLLRLPKVSSVDISVVSSDNSATPGLLCCTLPDSRTSTVSHEAYTVLIGYDNARFNMTMSS